MGDRDLTIGELAKRTGLATSALRYYEELGLLPAPGRVSGQRRYPESAVGLVGMILLLQDVGFSLGESKAFLASRTPADDGWHSLAHRKLADLDEQIAKAQTAKEAIAHALQCPHDDIATCPTFTKVIAARLAGRPFGGSPLTLIPHQSRGGDAALARPPSLWGRHPRRSRCRGTRLRIGSATARRGRLQRAVGTQWPLSM
jgi:DNA-binding transcriptional MerR regulator